MPSWKHVIRCRDYKGLHKLGLHALLHTLRLPETHAVRATTMLVFTNFSLILLFSIKSIHFKTVHQDAICQFPVRWIYYCHGSESTGKKTGKTHFCAVLCTIFICFNLRYFSCCQLRNVP